MTERISLAEAYDNRDVIAQLVRLRDNVDELLNILKDIDPNGDLTNVVTKTGDQTIDGVKTFIGQIVADCDIIQNGAAYETHAEQVFSHNDYIVMRDGVITSLPAGSYSGLQVKKYDGTNDCRLVVDNSGVARVGDINDEKPLMVRDEAADLADGALLKWNASGSKAVNEGTVGTDTKPIKIVNGVATAVTNELVDISSAQTVGGQKEFVLPLNLLSQSAGDDQISKIYKSGDTNNDILNLLTFSAGGTNDYASLRLMIHKTTHVATLVLVKYVNGTMTSTTIATL